MKIGQTITGIEFDWLAEKLTNATFKTAKSKTIPHAYTLRDTWANDNDFIKVVEMIRMYGYKEWFFNTPYIYFNINDYKYWTMGEEINKDGEWWTILINRAKIKRASPYDLIASQYDDLFSDEASIQEDKEIIAMIDYKGGSVLDVGCGTGLFLDYVKVDVENYLGYDISVNMLNAFANKHEHRILNTITTDFYTTEKYDYILGLYGVGSYLTKREIDKLERLLSPTGKMFLMFFTKGYYPATYSKTKIEQPFERIENPTLTHNNFDILIVQRGK